MPSKKPHKPAAKAATKKHSTTELKAEKELVAELNRLTKQVSRLQDLEVMYVYKQPIRFLWFAFLKGLMIGFGSVLGASFLVGLFIYLVSQIQLVPVVGDFVKSVLQELDSNNVVTENVIENQ